MADLEFPRIIYRGAHDALGLGTVGEQKRCESADDWAVDEKAGWRLVSAIDIGGGADLADGPAADVSHGWTGGTATVTGYTDMVKPGSESVEEPEESEAAPKARKPKAGK